MKLISLFVGLRSSFPMIISKIILNKKKIQFSTVEVFETFVYFRGRAQK